MLPFSLSDSGAGEVFCGRQAAVHECLQVFFRNLGFGVGDNGSESESVWRTVMFEEE